MKMILDQTARLTRTVVDFILPARCLACAVKVQSGPGLCSACWSDQQVITDPCCVRCGLPFEYDMGPAQECAACLTAPPAYDWCRTALAYEGVARNLLLGLKHRGRLANGRYFAQLMRPLVHGIDFAESPVLVPIPLHPRRLRQRRFNQALVLAEGLAALDVGAVHAGLLLRRRATRSQQGLGRKARIRNVAHAFSLAQGAKKIVTGKDVILIDDVLTTGATVEAAARLIHRLAPRSVGVLCATRAAGTR